MFTFSACSDDDNVKSNKDYIIPNYDSLFTIVDTTVYTIDLLGCGRSEKPDLTYTNYLFVQLISDFIKSEIGHRTDVIATGNSGTFVIMACDHNPELFDRLLLINPQSISACSHLPGKYAFKISATACRGAYHAGRFHGLCG